MDFAYKKNWKLTNGQIREIEIAKSKRGKPYFKEFRERTGCPDDVEFSISHSGEYWACLMGKTKVGLDIEDMIYRAEGGMGSDAETSADVLMERNKNRYEALAKRFFMPIEFDYVVKNGIMGFAEIWVRKEAYIKFSGQGLAQGLDTFQVIDEFGDFKMQLDQVFVKTIEFGRFSQNEANIGSLKNLKGAFCTLQETELEDFVLL